MKVHLFCLALLPLLLTSCATETPQRLPEFVPESSRPLSTEQKKSCASVYPAGRWQFAHAIEFTLADGSGNTVIGVTVLEGNEVSSTLMTIEGLTLFEARFTDKLEVMRAVPPFDKPSFAAGLMDDVRAIFSRPPGKNVRYGRFGENGAWCRITADDGRVTDIMVEDNDGWQINTYSAELIRTRTIIAGACKTGDLNLIPENLELTVPGPTGYTLKITLMSAEKMPISTSDNQKNIAQ